MRLTRASLLLAIVTGLFPNMHWEVRAADATAPAEPRPVRLLIHNSLRSDAAGAKHYNALRMPTTGAEGSIQVGATEQIKSDDQEPALIGPSFGPSLGPSSPVPQLAVPQPAVAGKVEVETKIEVETPVQSAPAETPKRNVLRPDSSDAPAAGPTIASPTILSPSTLRSVPTTSTAQPGVMPSPTEAKPVEVAESELESKPRSETKPDIVERKITTPVPATTTSPNRPAAPQTTVISDSNADRTPNRLLNPDGEETGKRAEISNSPADVNSQKLFESTGPTAKPLTPEMEMLRRRVQSSLATFYHNWTLNTTEHSPWEVMHAIIAYGVDTRLRHNGTNTTAIGHLCFSGSANKLPILTLRNNGLYVLRGPGVQGHSGQFLAILAQSHLQRDYPLYVGGKQFDLEDLIRAEQLDCESGTELTFKLIGLMHYLPSDAKWKNFQGQDWSIDRLVREEIVQPVRGAACGGTHRLMGLSYAVRKREQRGQPITGVYLEAQKYIDQYHRYTLGMQNPDGSFSTAWFVRRESRLDLDRRLQTTGHTLEWLCFSMSDEQLRDPRIVRSVRYVTDLLLNEKDHAWEIGHLGHALHALQLYNERVFGGPIRSYEGLVQRRAVKTAQRPGTATPEDSMLKLPFGIR